MAQEPEVKKNEYLLLVEPFRLIPVDSLLQDLDKFKRKFSLEAIFGIHTGLDDKVFGSFLSRLLHELICHFLNVLRGVCKQMAHLRKEVCKIE